MFEVFLTYPTPEGSQEIPVKEGKVSFGRGSEADYRFPDGGLSRLHSTIYREGDQVWIVDENSTNGTFVNGEQVAYRGTPLKNGDSISIGNETILKIRFLEKNAAQSFAPVNQASANVVMANSAAASSKSSFGVLPLALTGFALLVIGISAVFIAFKAFGGNQNTVQNNSYQTQIEDEDEEPRETPTPKKEITPEKTASPKLTTSDNTSLTNSPQNPTTENQVALPSGKKYLQMSETEKRQYIQVKAEKVASLIGNRNGDSITPLAVDRIKGFLDGYAKRANVGRLSGCRFGDNLQATYERASKNAPFIIKAFNERGVDPQIGLYLAMIESEHCVCLQSPTGPLGMFQFTFATAKLHFNPNTGIIKGASPASPDDRCRPEPAAHAAAEYMKFLTGRYGTGPASVPLAIGSYNSGEGGLSTNLKKALESNEALPRDFWTMIANGEKLSKQFQSENFKYVPKFFAAAIVGENPQDFGLSLQPLSTYTK